MWWVALTMQVYQGCCLQFPSGCAPRGHTEQKWSSLLDSSDVPKIPDNIYANILKSKKIPNRKHSGSQALWIRNTQPLPPAHSPLSECRSFFQDTGAEMRLSTLLTLCGTCFLGAPKHHCSRGVRFSSPLPPWFVSGLPSSHVSPSRANPVRLLRNLAPETSSPLHSGSTHLCFLPSSLLVASVYSLSRHPLSERDPGILRPRIRKHKYSSVITSTRFVSALPPHHLLFRLTRPSTPIAFWTRLSSFLHFLFSLGYHHEYHYNHPFLHSPIFHDTHSTNLQR